MSRRQPPLQVLATLSLRRLASPDMAKTSRRHASVAYYLHDISFRWKLQQDDKEVLVIWHRLANRWDGWSLDRRELLLKAVEVIVETEKQKQAWNPKAERARYERLYRSAITAAQLADEIVWVHGPHWKNIDAQAQDLVATLAGYVERVVAATYIHKVTLAGFRAQTLIDEVTKARGGYRRPPWDLIRDLVWLASGKSRWVNESTIRRYLTKTSSLQECWALALEAALAVVTPNITFYSSAGHQGDRG